MKLIVICGATATGKSRLALELGQRLQTRIVSADSRQVYRSFDIGTAKPTLEERCLVPHELVDVCDPTETMTVADYQARVRAVFDRFPDLPFLLVGGTGLYIKAIARGLKIPRVPPQPLLRSQLLALGRSHGYNLLKSVDPVAAERIHANDATRTLRALEVFYTTGVPISQQQGEQPPSYPILQIGVTAADLERRIAYRTECMVQQGLVDETDGLQRRYGKDLPLLKTLGYAEICQYLAGDLSLDAAAAQIVLHTRQFAKRQRSWFRPFQEIEWFDSDRPDFVEAVWKRVREFLGY